MIQTLRKKFIVIAMCSLALAMAGVIVIINVTNYINVRAEIVEVKNYIISQKQGKAKEKSADDTGKMKDDAERLVDDAQHQADKTVTDGEAPIDRQGHHFQNIITEMQYFQVRIDQDNKLMIDNPGNLFERYSQEEIDEIVLSALNKKADSGFIGQYYYSFVTMDDTVKRGIFLNCETRLASLRSLMQISILAYIGGLLFCFITVVLYSKRAVKPMEENLIQQKQFITNASHELKTPLTAISANMDVLTLEIGDNEWVHGTQKQISAMRSLVNEMVYLSRLDEEGYQLEMTKVNFSKIVSEAAEVYQMMEEISGKKLSVDIQEELYVKGNEQALTRMVSELCSNAQKYAPYEDQIVLTLKRVKNKVNLTIENGLASEMDDEALKQLFNRFYRADESRSKNEKNGFGIGLSIVKSIVEKHNGSIEVKKTEYGRILFSINIPW